MENYTVQALFADPPLNNLAECTVSGWVRTVRDSKAFGCVELNDGTHFKNLQIVLDETQTQNFADALKITLGSAIRATGDVV